MAVTQRLERVVEQLLEGDYSGAQDLIGVELDERKGNLLCSLKESVVETLFESAPVSKKLQMGVVTLKPNSDGYSVSLDVGSNPTDIEKIAAQFAKFVDSSKGNYTAKVQKDGSVTVHINGRPEYDLTMKNGDLLFPATVSKEDVTYFKQNGAFPKTSM